MKAEKFGERLELIVKALSRVAKTLGDDVSAERIMLTAEILEKELNDDQIVTACFEVMKREVRFPPPIKFIDQGKGNEKVGAEEAVEKVFSAIRLFGDMGGEGAKQYLGPAIWRIIQSFGGWYSLCTRDDFNTTVFRSQFISSFTTRVPHWESSGELDEMLALENPNHPLKQIGWKAKDLNEAIKPRHNLKLISEGEDEDV